MAYVTLIKMCPPMLQEVMQEIFVLFFSPDKVSFLKASTECLLHKATSPTSGIITDLPNTQKLNRHLAQNEETEKYVPNEGTRPNL